MRICVISPSYPTSKSIDFVFVDQLCRAFADLGNDVVVIAPQSITKCLFRRIPLTPKHSWYETTNGARIELYRPYTISLSNSKLGKIFKNSFQNAVKRAFNSMKKKPDICYGHFWASIFSIYPLANEYSIPLFGASGEEDVSLYVHKSKEYIDEIRNYLSGIVSVSTKNQSECFALNLVDSEKSIVIPNAIDQTLFRKIDKKECRHQLGVSLSDFVVVFVGQFVPRKGTLRLNAALKQIRDPQIKVAFIGTGIEDPDYEGIIYKGRVAHDKLPCWLNAADVFVLPTQNEGCCNAIIEAMACGLPVISSNLPFNWDVLNEHNSIMVAPDNIKEIASAIKTLKNHSDIRKSMSENALESAAELSIVKRAERIINFIKDKTIK